MTAINIRPFDHSESDYQQAVGVFNQVWPEFHDTVELWRFHDERLVPGFLFQRHVLERNGRIVGMSEAGQSPGSFEPGKFWTFFCVHPEHRQQGLGTALFNHLLDELSRHEPKKLTSWTSEEQFEGVRYLQQRGFQQTMRYPRSELDVNSFDPAPFAGKVERVINGPIQIRTLTQLLDSDPECKTRLYDAIWEFLQDVPSPDPLTRFPQDVWEKRTFENPDLLPDGWQIAVDGDRYVGLTMLFRNSGSRKILETGLTGVSRSHRRLGIATAVKVLAIQYARENGYDCIRTDNEENNPMFQLNLALGFKPTPAGLDFVRYLQ